MFHLKMADFCLGKKKIGKEKEKKKKRQTFDLGMGGESYLKYFNASFTLGSNSAIIRF